MDLGNATLLPGFFELHAHLLFQCIPANTVLKHEITTVRDVGGPVHNLMAVPCMCGWNTTSAAPGRRWTTPTRRIPVDHRQQRVAGAACGQSGGDLHLWL